MERTLIGIEVAYGDSTRILRVPRDNLAWVVGPRSSRQVASIAQAVRKAIRSPIDAPTLPDLVRSHGNSTVILVDDGTRSTPQHLVLPIVLDELNAAGVSDRHITALIALGTHRRMSDAECLSKFGKIVMERIRIQNLSQDPADFVDLGITARGVPIQISRRYLESDVSIAVGNIVPHMYAGWAGGAKMIQPGVSSPLTTAWTHLMAGPHVYDILGQVDNPVRREMEEIAIKSGLKFIVNVVLNRDGGVVAVVAGDTVSAHRAGVRIASPIYTVNIDERADIVIASSHPADRDLWQGFKPVNNCGMMARDGGTLILLIPASEGIAPDHPSLVHFGQLPADDVRMMAESAAAEPGGTVDCVAAATYLAWDQTRQRVSVILVTDGISEDQGARIGLAAMPDFDAALAAALARHGSEARIGVVTHGADVIGRFKQQATCDEKTDPI